MDEQLPVEGIRMVKVDGLALLVRQTRRIIIIRIQWHDGHVVGRQCFHDLLHYRCLAGACTAGYTDNCWFIVHIFLY